MANRISTEFSFREQGSGLKKIKADMAEVDGSINKAKVGIKGLWAEFSGNRAAQAAVAGLAIKIGKDAVQAASNLEESLNAVNVTYGENADAVTKLGEESAESFGLSQRAFNEFAVQFSSFAQQVAQRDGRAVSDVVNEMTTRVADFASVMNLDVSEAARVFQSALAGETEPIKKFGIDMSAAAVEAYALENGLAASKKEITESVKVAARYGLLMKSTAATSGDFKNTQDGLANSTRTLQAQFEDLQATLGRQLLPMVSDTTATLVDLASVTGDLADQLENLGQVIPGPVRELQKLAGGNFIADAFIKKPLEGFSWALDKVGMSAEESAFSLDEATKAAWQHRSANIKAGVESENAAKAAEDHAESLRDNAREATYNADANEEMGRIQSAVTDIVDKARKAQEKFLDSIKHTRDEVGKLKREIDDQQAWISYLDTVDAVNEKLNDQETSSREAYSAVLELKEATIEYAESINLPDRVVTNLIAQIDAGKAAEVQAFLQRIQNGVTLPIVPQVRQSFNRASSSRGGPTLTSEGNLIPGRASGGPVRAGETYVVGEQGPEILQMGNQSGNVIPNDKIGGSGPVTFNINVTAPAGSNADEFGRKVWEAIRRESRWRGPIEGM